MHEINLKELSHPFIMFILITLQHFVETIKFSKTTAMNFLKGTREDHHRLISGDDVVKNTDMRPFPVTFINSCNTELSYSDFAMFELILVF